MPETSTPNPSNTDPPESKRRPRGPDWADPDIPAGNAPPMPRWPLALAAVTWGLWIVFLFVTLLTRARIAPI